MLAREWEESPINANVPRPYLRYQPLKLLVELLMWETLKCKSVFRRKSNLPGHTLTEEGGRVSWLSLRREEQVLLRMHKNSLTDLLKPHSTFIILFFPNDLHQCFPVSLITCRLSAVLFQSSLSSSLILQAAVLSLPWPTLSLHRHGRWGSSALTKCKCGLSECVEGGGTRRTWAINGNPAAKKS